MSHDHHDDAYCIDNHEAYLPPDVYQLSSSPPPSRRLFAMATNLAAVWVAVATGQRRDNRAAQAGVKVEASRHATVETCDRSINHWAPVSCQQGDAQTAIEKRREDCEREDRALAGQASGEIRLQSCKCAVAIPRQ
jgi:hypothetical protein